MFEKILRYSNVLRIVQYLAKLAGSEDLNYVSMAKQCDDSCTSLFNNANAGIWKSKDDCGNGLVRGLPSQ